MDAFVPGRPSLHEIGGATQSQPVGKIEPGARMDPMPFFSHGEIAHLLTAYGYLVVALMVGIEGMGIPCPAIRH